MVLYCYIDSTLGFATNLQLYSLRQAYRDWIYLQEHNDNLTDEKIKEICVFITATLGLSLSQLLGQNFPGPHTREGVPAPKKLFENIMPKYFNDTNKYNTLKNNFFELVDFYDASRHFGLDKDKKRHDKMDDITIYKVNDFLKTAFDIWDYIILFKKNEKNSQLYEYTNIKDLLDNLEEGNYQEDLIE